MLHVITVVSSFVSSFRRNEKGQDLLEYALLVALIALVAIGGVTLAGERVDEIFTAVAGEITVPAAP